VAPSRRSSFSTTARPAATVCASALALNHWRILWRERALFTKPRSGLSQSREGPPLLAATISTR
jgi:hypothetical protein